MSDELEKILADKKDPASEEKPQDPKSEEVQKEESRLANIKKAIDEANQELKRVRKQTKDAKQNPQPEEEELPRIDLDDPNSKAWDKHFNAKVNPLAEELEKEKEEVRTFALREFLESHPNLAQDPEKVKKVISTYDRIKTASERTREGVLIDLRKAYAAEFHEELIQDRTQERIERAQGDAIFSDPAVSRGSTSYRSEKEKVPHLSREDEAILARWGLTPQEWVKMKQEQDKKNG